MREREGEEGEKGEGEKEGDGGRDGRREERGGWEAWMKKRENGGRYIVVALVYTSIAMQTHLLAVQQPDLRL